MKMQTTNSKIKEEIDDTAHNLVGVASIYVSSEQPQQQQQQQSLTSPAHQQKIILSPRIEIHRVVKNHETDITYDRSENSSPIYDEKSLTNGGNVSPEAIQQHQFVTPTCRLANYRESRTDKPITMIATQNIQTNAMQRVHVIKDGRFYEESHYVDLQQTKHQHLQQQQINDIERDHRRSNSPEINGSHIHQMQRAINENDHTASSTLTSTMTQNSPSASSPSSIDTVSIKQRTTHNRQIIVNPNTVSSSNQPMRPPPPPPPKVKSVPTEEPSSSIPDLGK